MKKKNVITRVLSVLTMCALLAASTACGSSTASSTPAPASSAANAASAAASASDSAEGPAMKRIKASGEMKLATSPGYAPYDFIDLNKSATEITGIDIALGQRIADKLGVKLKVVEMTFGSIIGSLSTDTVDITISGMTPTEERKKSIDFSDIYIQAEQRILCREADKDKYKTLADLKGKKIGAQKSTSQEKLANSQIEGASVVALEKLPDVVLQLISGKIDAVVIEDTVAQQYINSDQGLALCDAQFPDSVKNKPTAIGINKGNEDFMKVINEVIAESKSDGSIEKWIKDYSEIALNASKAKK